MKFVNFKNDKLIRKDIEPLYISAFPEEERPPEWLFFENALKEDNELLGFYDGDKFIGFTNLLFYKDLCYMFFLAVSPEARNKGYGSQIIQEAFKLYPNNTFVLCYEEIDDKYPDIELRKRRKNFYYRNGFKDNEMKTCEYGVNYETCYIGSHKVNFEDYLGLYKSVFGDKIESIIKEIK